MVSMRNYQEYIQVVNILDKERNILLEYYMHEYVSTWVHECICTW
jgi:hypothetical protein